MSALLVQPTYGEPQVCYEEFKLGRDHDEFPFDDYASKDHCRIWPEGMNWLVEDLGSTNGTWLNGTRVYGPTKINGGDRLRIGRVVLTLVPA